MANTSSGQSNGQGPNDFTRNKQLYSKVILTEAQVSRGGVIINPKTEVILPRPGGSGGPSQTQQSNMTSPPSQNGEKGGAPQK